MNTALFRFMKYIFQELFVNGTVVKYAEELFDKVL